MRRGGGDKSRGSNTCSIEVNQDLGRPRPISFLPYTSMLYYTILYYTQDPIRFIIRFVKAPLLWECRLYMLEMQFQASQKVGSCGQEMPHTDKPLKRAQILQNEEKRTHRKLQKHKHGLKRKTQSRPSIPSSWISRSAVPVRE